MDKVGVYDKIIIENKKKRKYGNPRKCYINHHLKDRLQTNSQLAKAS